VEVTCGVAESVGERVMGGTGCCSGVIQCCFISFVFDIEIDRKSLAMNCLTMPSMLMSNMVCVGGVVFGRRMVGAGVSAGRVAGGFAAVADWCSTWQ